MADNIVEEHVENPENNLPENPADQITPPTDSETISPNQETDNMEVHHHAHDPAAPHHKKSWKSYFWEFLMLFLAVFCGFLAEYQLEHIIEHKREKQFIRSYIEDLKRDTAGFARSIRFKNRRQNNIDSALFPLTRLVENDVPLSICLNLHNVLKNPYFFSTDGTVQQLKVSGGMRLIRNREAVDSIEAYDFQIRRIMLRQEQGAVADNEFKRILNNLLPGKTIFAEQYDSLYREKTYDPKKNIKINAVYLNELINQLGQIRSDNGFEITFYNDIKNKATAIMKFLSQEYDLE